MDGRTAGVKRVAQIGVTLAIGLVGSGGLVSGCVSIPQGRAAVDDVDVEGTSEVDSEELTDAIATTKSPRFLGLFRGVVFDYEVFDRLVLQRDLQRIERYYRARGFYRARVRAGRIFYEDREHVRVVIEVEEGPPVLVKRLDIRGMHALPRDLQDEARLAGEAELKRDDRFDEDRFAAAETAVRRALTDRGYAHAKVRRAADIDLPRNRASVAYDVVPHLPARFGEVSIEGRGDLPEAPIRRALDIQAGEEYSTASIESARQALLELGVFSSVTIEPVLDDPPQADRVVPLKVILEPSKLKSVRLGGGIQLDATRADVHLLAGWEHRNFLGGLRRFSVEFRPGVVLYPTRITNLQSPTDFLPEEKLRAELRQPGFIEARTSGFIASEFNIYPVLISTEVDEEAPILGYRELRGAVGVDRTFFGHAYLRPSHNVQSNMPFTYVGVLDSDLHSVLVSYPEIFGSLDFRDDRVEPHRGVFLSMTAQVAGVGGDARDLKLQPEVRGYVPLGKRLTFAARATAGTLFAQNYGSSTVENAEGNIPPPSVDRAGWVRDLQIGFLRGFYAGGPASNRGYPVRGIGPHGAVPFYSPELSAQEIAVECNPFSPDFEPARCLLPLGGFTLWEASLELRFPISGPVGGAMFCDTADVSPAEVDFRFDRPHLSCGLGLRYDTPIGPIRLDVGYRVPGLQLLGDDSGEKDPGTIFGLPIAIAFGVGEAF